MSSDDNVIRTDSMSMTVNSAATMIGFSTTIITLIVTMVNKPESFISIKYILIFYMLAIIFLIFSIDSFTLAASDLKNYQIWSTSGSIAYGLGMGWVIIGISLTFDTLVNLTLVAYLTITLFMLMYGIHYFLRWKLKKEDPYKKSRIVARALMALQIFIGYVLIYELR